MSFFNLFSKTNIPLTDSILNTGLTFLLRSPFDLNIDLKGKLLIKFPCLTQEQVVEYDSICRNAYKFGHYIIYESMIKRLKSLGPMTEQELKSIYRQEMHKRFPWANKRNLKSIYNLASYSLEHDGLVEFKK